MLKKKSIMLLSHACLSDPRVQFEAKLLAEAGYEVHIVAWDREAQGESLTKLDGYTIHRIVAKAQYGSGIKQYRGMLQFYWRAFKYMKDQSLLGGVVHAHDLDTLPLGFYAAKRFKLKLVYDAHEIYSEQVFRKHKGLRLVLENFEKWLLKSVDCFITVGTVRSKWYEAHGYPKKPVILANWKKPEVPDMRLDAFDVAKRLDGTYTIAYIGAMGYERKIETLLKAVEKDVRFSCIIGGAGQQLEMVEAYAASCDRIIYVGYVKDPHLMAYYTMYSDVLYYGLDDDYLITHTAVPNKLFEAITYQKLFLASIRGEIASISPNQDLFIPVEGEILSLEPLFKRLKDPVGMPDYQQEMKRLGEIYHQDRAKEVLLSLYETLYKEGCYE